MSTQEVLSAIDRAKAAVNHAQVVLAGHLGVPLGSNLDDADEGATSPEARALSSSYAALCEAEQGVARTTGVTIDQAIAALQEMRERSPLKGETCLAVSLTGSEIQDSMVARIMLEDDDVGAVVYLVVEEHDLRERS